MIAVKYVDRMSGEKDGKKWYRVKFLSRSEEGRMLDLGGFCSEQVYDACDDLAKTLMNDKEGNLPSCFIDISMNKYGKLVISQVCKKDKDEDEEVSFL